MIYMANNSDFNSDVEMIFKDLFSRAATDHLQTKNIWTAYVRIM